MLISSNFNFFKWAIVWGIAFVLVSCASLNDTLTLESVLAKHAQARGGATAIEQVKTIQLSVDVKEAKFNVKGTYRATREGWMRVDIFSDGVRVFTEALGPTGGWQMSADGQVSDLSPKGESALVRGVANNLYGMHEWPSLGISLKLLGGVVRNDKACWVLEKISANGFSERIFIDQETYLIVSQIETSALHPDVDAKEARQETLLSDYRWLNNILFSEKSEKINIDTGEVMQTAIVESRRINGVIDKALFLRPKHDA